MPALAQHNPSEVLARVRGGDAVSVVYYPPVGGDFARYFPAKGLGCEFEEIDCGRNVWMEVCYIQHVSVHSPMAKDVAAVASITIFLASVGAKRRRSVVTA